MVAMHQTLKIIFEVQRKRNNEKIRRWKITFPTYKNTLFFLFSSLWTCLTFKLFRKQKCLIVDLDKLVYSTYRRNCNCPLYQEIFCAFLHPEALNSGKSLSCKAPTKQTGNIQIPMQQLQSNIKRLHSCLVKCNKQLGTKTIVTTFGGEDLTLTFEPRS
jgi:hypothetical protein